MQAEGGGSGCFCPEGSDKKRRISHFYFNVSCRGQDKGKSDPPVTVCVICRRLCSCIYFTPVTLFRAFRIQSHICPAVSVGDLNAFENILVKNDAALEIALRSRGTARIANALLKRVRDFAQVLGDGRINLEIARFALNKLKIDKRGLDSIDHKILRTLIINFKGGPVGVGTLATSIAEDAGTLEEVYEPFLIKEGFLVRTQRGRMATELAYSHLGMESYLPQRRYNPDESGSLF